MSRNEEIARYCEDMGFPLGSCSSINSVKSITASDAIKWADRTTINKAIDILIDLSNDGRLIDIHNQEEFEKQFRKKMEE